MGKQWRASCARRARPRRFRASTWFASSTSARSNRARPTWSWSSCAARISARYSSTWDDSRFAMRSTTCFRRATRSPKRTRRGSFIAISSRRTFFSRGRSDGLALVKVLDFGISKAMDAELRGLSANLTATSAVMGSPLYMSPEQVRNAKQVDARADIWSLGVILHELLTGSPAFSRHAARHLRGDHRRRAAAAPHAPRRCAGRARSGGDQVPGEERQQSLPDDARSDGRAANVCLDRHAPERVGHAGCAHDEGSGPQLAQPTGFEPTAFIETGERQDRSRDPATCRKSSPARQRCLRIVDRGIARQLRCAGSFVEHRRLRSGRSSSSQLVMGFARSVFSLRSPSRSERARDRRMRRSRPPRLRLSPRRHRESRS